MDEAQETILGLIHGGKTVATAESCTGGLVGSLLTGVPGSSKAYLGGAITYCNAMKQKLLGVDAALLRARGAVCAPVAEQMAQGVRALTGADYGVATTGVAGPGADDLGNPEGLVFIAAAGECGAEVREVHLSGTRDAIRTQAAQQALQLLLAELRK